MRRFVLATGSVASLIFFATAARAEVNLALNAEGAATHMVGDTKTSQFGWGAAAIVAPELKLGRKLGIELPLGIVGLSESSTQDPSFAKSSAGSAFFAMAGLRFRPFATPAGGVGDALWIAGGGGISDTGGLARPSVDVRAGVDVPWKGMAVGPFGGLIQIVETDPSVRPEDARLAIVGLHASIERKSTPKDGDRDGDGIPDSVDKCPDEGGFVIRDEKSPYYGCPDTDHDGIPDAIDKCPTEPETFNGFQDEDGCPDEDPDRDHDGIPNELDKCPDQGGPDVIRDAESPYYGCPDRDHDGIPDAIDQCPDEPETYNGFADDDGCPDEDQVRVTGDLIVLDDRVHFRVNQSEILLSSYPLLTRVAKLLKDHPEYELVQVDGHADDTGAETYNLRLSEARARSVKALLVSFGVPEARLSIEFFGESKPRIAAQTVDARRQNRRVEFEIIRRRVRTETTTALAPRTDGEAKETGK